MLRVLTGPLTVEQVTVPIRDLPAHLDGCRIVQLSDFHFDGVRLSIRLLEEAIATTNRLSPDLIALTGDFVTDEATPIAELCRYLKRLESQRGTVAVLGNHDNKSRRDRKTILATLRAADITALWNEIAYPLGENFPVVGFADVWSGHFKPALLMDTLDPTCPRLVLSHNPDTAVPLQRWRVDLQLSGHTHGGQIVLPRVGPLPSLPQQLCRVAPGWSLPLLKQLLPEASKAIKRWDLVSGLHQVGNNTIYVNRGLGTYLPGRFQCPPEVTLLTLVAAK